MTQFDTIRVKIEQFIKVEKEKRKNLQFDMVRLGINYQDKNILIPIDGISNGYVVAIANNCESKDFTHYGNKL